MKSLIYCSSEERLDAFAAGFEYGFGPGAALTISHDDRGYWLLIEDREDGDNQTYELGPEGLVHTDTGVEI